MFIIQIRDEWPTNQWPLRKTPASSPQSEYAGSRQQGHAGSKIYQPSPPALNWRCQLMPVDLYSGRKTVVGWMFTDWMFPNVSSSNCAWMCINVCTAWHRSTSPSCAFRLRMLPDAVNSVLLAEDFWIFLAKTCRTMVDVHSVSPVLTSGTHFFSISGNRHQ